MYSFFLFQDVKKRFISCSVWQRFASILIVFLWNFTLCKSEKHISAYGEKFILCSYMANIKLPLALFIRSTSIFNPTFWRILFMLKLRKWCFQVIGFCPLLHFYMFPILHFSTAFENRVNLRFSKLHSIIFYAKTKLSAT